MERKILVVGSSHTAVIAKAAAGVDNVNALWVKNPKRDDGPGDITIQQASEAVAALTPSDILAITWVGTYHNIFGLAQHEQPFDFFEPDSSEEPDLTRELIPYGTLHRQFAMTTGRDVVTRKIGGNTKAKVVLLATPPVKGDDDFIRAKLKLKNYRGQSIDEVGVTPASIRAKLWRLEMRCVESYCIDINAEFLPVPDAAFTDEGFLRTDLYGSDATHANVKYGAMVVEQLLHLKRGQAIQSA
ncbi:hypothetical protein [Pararhizobium sp. A13]|uniref:hypothetical protein n=1 Tax=Pararhizobium sp. A13 TaxID=3133975 RepID=UPI00311B25E5